jgi:hypothetical protein
MKKAIIISGILLIVTTSCIKNIICINGNGDLQTAERIAAGFNQAVNTTSVNVVYRRADSTSITITAESNLIPHILTVVNSGRLEIRTDPRNACFDARQTPLVTITSPELNFMELTGSGNFQADTLSGSSVEVRSSASGEISVDIITCEDLDIHLTGSGDIEIINATCREAILSATGSGDLTISGSGETLDVQTTGSGSMEALGFMFTSVKARVTGSGNIHTHALNSLNAVITGSGNIYVRGNPVINQTITGSGKIIKQ